MSTYIPARTRAIDVWRSIMGNPTSVEFVRPKVNTKTGPSPETTLPAQTVRISKTVKAVPVEGDTGIAPRREVTIFGIRQHPTQDDTDMAEGYTAEIDGDNYRITEVILEPGEIRARAVVIG